MIISSTHSVEGRQITAYLDIVSAESVQGVNVIRDMFAGMRDFFGGRSQTLERALKEARIQATDELKDRARALQADAVVGGAWVGTALLQTRVPLASGRDDVQNGVFVRGDLGVGRRLSGWVPSLGLSALRQAPDANGSRGYSELAAQATANVSLGGSWGLDAGIRVPVTDAMYTFALRVGATWVVGKKPDEPL